MQKLSQSLETLSVRAKKLEDSGTAAFEADRAKLEQRRRKIDTALTADRDEFESAVVTTRNYLGSPRRLALRGVAAIFFGIATLIWPDVTLWALVVLWGAYALFDGTVALTSAIADRYLLHRGWVAVSGISGIVAGAMTFVWPGITALALLFVIAAWSLVNGFSLIGIAVSERKRLTGEWVIALTGILSVFLGVVLMVTPGAGALTITWAIGWWACISGGASLWTARTVHHELQGSDNRQLGRDSHAHALG